MGNPNQRCSICSAPLEVRIAVDAAIRSREKFRDLAARTPFSSSSLNRHARKCIGKAVLEAYNAKIRQPQNERIVVRWPDGKMNTLNSFDEEPVQLRDSDVIFAVSYRKPVPITVAVIDLAIAEDLERSQNSSQNP